MVLPVDRVTPQTEQTVSPVYPSLVQVAALALNVEAVWTLAEMEVTVNPRLTEL